MDKNIIEGLKSRYKDIHPLIFYRSLEKAKTPGELFDILEDFPYKYPVIWNNEIKKWTKIEDIFQSGNFNVEE